MLSLSQLNENKAGTPKSDNTRYENLKSEYINEAILGNQKEYLKKLILETYKDVIESKA